MVTLVILRSFGDVVMTGSDGLYSAGWFDWTLGQTSGRVPDWTSGRTSGQTPGQSSDRTVVGGAHVVSGAEKKII